MICNPALRILILKNVMAADLEIIETIAITLWRGSAKGSLLKKGSCQRS